MGNHSQTPQKILAIETSGKTMSIALAEVSRDVFTLRGDLFFDVGLRHSEILKDCCMFLMQKCLWQKEDLTALTVCTGPGSFTGLRVGISFARAMAQVLEIPLIGVPAFELIAHSIQPEIAKSKTLGVLIDSIGNEVFAGFFKSPNLSHPIQPYRVYWIDELCKDLKKRSQITLVGQGFLRYENQIRSYLGTRIVTVDKALQVPQAKTLAEIAAKKISSSMFSKNSWEKVVPFYLRPPIAVERKETYRIKRRDNP